jgi:sulfotransferase family protein
VTAEDDPIRPDGPDFFCIGAQKAGTGWLYQQLRQHPDFWMPPMKELHYFDRMIGGSASERTLPLARNEADRIKIASERAENERDKGFVRKFSELSAQAALDLEAYAALFRARDRLVSGDITPGYSTLDESIISKIAARFPDAKVIFIARDPIERAWSQISMYVRRKLIKAFDPDDVDQISQHLELPEIQARSYPSETVRRWSRHISSDRFAVYFFDNLKSDPGQLRASIIGFLGGDPEKPSGSLPPGFNTKADKAKLARTPAAQRHLAQFFASELRACATELGGPAKLWPARYGL